MRPLLFITMLVGMLIASQLNGQTTLEGKLAHYDKENQPDSAYLLIDTYARQFESNGQWDSLVYVLHQKCNLYFRFETVSEVQKIVDYTTQIAEQHLPDNDYIYLDFLDFKTDFLQDIGAFTEAEKIMDKMITVSAGMKNDTTGSLAYYKAEKAFLLLNLGRIKEAEALASSVYDGIVARGDTSQMISVLQSLTVANQWLNNYDKALIYNEMNLDLISQYFDPKHPNIGLIQSQMAEIYADKGQTNKALDYYNKSKNLHLENYKKTGASRFLGSSLGNLGDFYANIGEYRLAIDYLSYSLELNEEEYGQDSWNNMWHYSVLSTACRLYEDYDQADYYINKAFRLIELSEESTPYDYHFFLSRKAEMAYERDQYDSALEMALQVQKYYSNNEDFGSTNDRLHILNLLTNIYRDSGSVEEALQWTQKNIEYHEKNSEPLSSIRINVLTNLMPIYADLREASKAYALKEKILKLRNNGNGVFTLSNCIPDSELLNFAVNWVEFLDEKSTENADDKEEYFEFLKEFEAYYSVHLSTIKTNSNLAANEIFIKRIYTPAIHFFAESDPAKSLLYVEKCKRFSTQQILQSQLIEDENLPTLDFMIDNKKEVTEDSIPIDIFFDIVASLDSVAVYKDSLFKADPISFEKYFGMNVLTIKDIESIIDVDELMVEYFISDSSVFAFYIQHNKVMSKLFDLGEVDRLARKVLNFRDVTAGKELRQLLLPDDIIEQFNKIKLLPDGILNSISFEQLYDQDQPLIYTKLISYGLSASVLIHQKKLTKEKQNRNQFLGLTPGFTRDLKTKMQSTYLDLDSSYLYLIQQPFLLSLSESLSRDFDGESYQELAATEHMFKQKAQDYRILHIGTHGVLNDDAPLFSKLIFAKDSLEDGYLHAYELYGKNLNADLAVLSACSSGKEKTYASEGIVSLSHAFTHAGCPSVLMTKWDVDEKSTSIILELFYKNLKDGKSKSVALHEAKLTFLANAPAELHDPYYWAGLVLIGDDSAIFATPWYKDLIWIFVLVLLVIGGGVLWRNRRSIL
ncbi:MAG: CHAT domain-containing protein [Saprospiraceae bacterium]|nr:CHAT domain-containing protein [Saprospiraceae bacterium]